MTCACGCNTELKPDSVGRIHRYVFGHHNRTSKPIFTADRARREMSITGRELFLFVLMFLAGTCFGFALCRVLLETFKQ